MSALCSGCVNGHNENSATKDIEIELNCAVHKGGLEIKVSFARSRYKEQHLNYIYRLRRNYCLQLCSGNKFVSHNFMASRKSIPRKVKGRAFCLEKPKLLLTAKLTIF